MFLHDAHRPLGGRSEIPICPNAERLLKALDVFSLIAASQHAWNRCVRFTPLRRYPVAYLRGVSSAVAAAVVDRLPRVPISFTDRLEQSMIGLHEPNEHIHLA